MRNETNKMRVHRRWYLVGFRGLRFFLRAGGGGGKEAAAPSGIGELDPVLPVPLLSLPFSISEAEMEETALKLGKTLLSAIE